MSLKILETTNLSEIYGKDKFDKWNKKYKTLSNRKVKDWLLSKISKYSAKGKNPKKFQLINYIKAFNDYCTHVAELDNNTKEIPDKLLNEDSAQRNKRFMEYITYRLSNGIGGKCSIINNYQSRIMGFFSYHGKPITEFIESLKQGSELIRVDLEPEQISQIINSIRSIDYKVALKFIALCGLRGNDVLEELVSLKSGTKNPKYQIEYSEKHDIHFIRGFITSKEQVVINFLFLPRELERLLLTAYGNLCDFDLRKLDLTKILMNRIENGNSYKRKHIDRNDLSKTIKRVAEKLKVIIKLDDRPNGEPIYDKTLGLHNFREYFTSKIREAYPNTPWLTNHFEGHTNLNLDDAYNRKLKSLDWMYNKWKFFNDELYIDVEIRDNTNEEVLSLKQENFQLRQQVSDIAEKGDTQTKLISDLKEIVSILLESNPKAKELLKTKKEVV